MQPVILAICVRFLDFSEFFVFHLKALATMELELILNFPVVFHKYMKYAFTLLKQSAKVAFVISYLKMR